MRMEKMNGNEEDALKCGNAEYGNDEFEMSKD